jgi:hypothetical protein
MDDDKAAKLDEGRRALRTFPLPGAVRTTLEGLMDVIEDQQARLEALERLAREQEWG